MNKKITRILSVVLSLTMLLGSLIVPTTVSAAPGEQQWFSESLPTGSNVAPYSSFFIWPGASVVDIAVADASTIYAAVSHVTASERGIFKSTNAGQSWSKVPVFPTEATQNPTLITVAPDNPNSIAVVDAVSGVHVSNDGGTTWSTLPAIATPLTTHSIRDIAAAPARSGTLLGREYFVAVSDTAAGPGLLGLIGDCMMIGATAAWQSVAAAGIAGVYDVTSVAVSPNFSGDRCVVLLGTTATAGSTSLIIVNTSLRVIVSLNPTTLYIIAIGAAGIKDYDTGLVNNDILSSDVALPTNFDPSTSAGRRAYIGIRADIPAPGPYAANDVYRVDNDSPRALGTASASGVHSVAYNGTVDAGKLFMGQGGNTDVRWTDAPTTTSPTWTTTTKGPSGKATTAPLTVVKLAADFSTTSRVFAGTSGPAGDHNEFAISNNGGVSFNGEAFINFPTILNTAGTSRIIGQVQGTVVSNDGKTVFICSDDTIDLSVWKSGSSVSGTSWSRVLFVANGTTGLLAISPEYDKTPAVFFANLVAGGVVYVSQNGGDTFASRNAPSLVTFTAIAAQDANTLYAGDASGQIYKSTNAGWIWATGVPGRQTGGVTSILVPRFDDVLVGGTGGASYSVDGGANFTAINTGLGAAVGAVYIAYDSKYSGNKTIYAGGGTDGNTYRYVIGTSATWEDIQSPTGAALTGLAQVNGTLYAQSVLVVDRALNPTVPTGSINWSIMNAGAATAAMTWLAVSGTKTENIVYCGRSVVPAGLPLTGNASLYTYKDVLAVSLPELTSPADKATIGVDPVNGRGDPITVAFKKMGTGTGLINLIEVEIREKATGLTGTPTYLMQTRDPPAGIVNGNAFTVAPEAPSTLIAGWTVVGGATQPFRANTEYVWAIRACNTVSNDGVMSNWTAPRTFTIQSGGAVVQEHIGPIVTSPQGGATNVDPKLVGFTWAPVYGATEYTVIVATDAALTKTVAGTPVKVTATSFQATNLEYGTTYFYSVQATKPTVSPTAIGSFTTAQKPVPPVTTTPAPPVTPQILFPKQETPAYVWAIIVIGAVLIIAVIVLVVRTRRVP
jgi:hypothetical protein